MIARLVIIVLTVIAPWSESRSQERWPVSIEATVGLGVGDTNGDYRDNGTGVTADVSVAWRVRPSNKGGFVGGLNWAGQGTGPTSDICILRTDGTCVPRFPDFFIIGALLGWENGRENVRFLAGPARVDAGSSILGWQARLDASVPLAWHVSVLGSARGILLPDYRGDQFRLGALGIGLRLR